MNPRPSAAEPTAARIDPRLVRRIVLVVFVLGIAGMIVGSIRSSNGAAMTFGLITAVAALALVLVSSVTPSASSEAAAPVVDERLAADLEDRIGALVADGADEEAVRRLVGRAVELGRGS
ncbi:MAG: hypothetical protein FGM58_09115 [Acidimicrobiia bacterium]|nr:hypothetical protein [Acidimicrobiia bacterium]